MLRSTVVVPNDRTAYAQGLVTELSQAHKYMSDNKIATMLTDKVLRYLKTSHIV